MEKEMQEKLDLQRQKLEHELGIAIGPRGHGEVSMWAPQKTSTKRRSSTPKVLQRRGGNVKSSGKTQPRRTSRGKRRQPSRDDDDTIVEDVDDLRPFEGSPSTGDAGNNSAGVESGGA